MSLSIRLFKFSKKRNSTLEPTYTGSLPLGSVTLKSPTSITNPTFTIRWPDDDDIDLDYNYVWCEDLHRYYWIDDMILVSDKIYDIVCSVDVLSTYRTEIGNLTPYILRSGSVQSGNVPDTYYPIEGSPYEMEATSDQYPWHNTARSHYIYTMTLLGYEENTTTYPNHPLKVLGGTFMLLGSQSQIQSNLDTLNSPVTIQHTAVPSDFIIQMMAFPFLTYYSSTYKARTVKALLGAEWTMTLTDCDMSDNPDIDDEDYIYKSPVYHITRYNHPQANARGDYLNFGPYTEIKMYAGPFGSIDLDPSVFSMSYISYCFDVDLTTGDAILKIWPSPTKSTTRERGVVVIQGKCGINIPINTISQRTPFEFSASPATNVANLVNFGLEFVGKEGSLNYAPVSTPKISGVPDSIVSYYNPYCKYIFHYVSEDNHDEWGYPLVMKRKINTAYGYVLCATDTFTFANARSGRMTSAELDQLRTYLTGGFFYE